MTVKRKNLNLKGETKINGWKGRFGGDSRKNELLKSENEILNVFPVKRFFYEPNIIVIGRALARGGLGV